MHQVNELLTKAGATVPSTIARRHTMPPLPPLAERRAARARMQIIEDKFRELEREDRRRLADHSSSASASSASSLAMCQPGEP